MGRSNQERNDQRQSGAIIIEFVFLFPLFLTGILILIFLGVGYNAKASLNSAVGMVRQAYTRGQAELVGAEMLSEINDYYRSGGPLPSVLYANVSEADARDYYQEKLHDVFRIGASNDDFLSDLDGDGFSDIPMHYAYAHAYVALSMKQSVGPGLKYPCKTDEPGCLECWNLTPSMFDDSPDDWWNPPRRRIRNPNYPQNFIGIQCKYRTGNEIVSLVDRLIGIASGKGAASSVIEMQSTPAYFCFGENPCFQ